MKSLLLFATLCLIVLFSACGDTQWPLSASGIYQVPYTPQHSDGCPIPDPTPNPEPTPSPSPSSTPTPAPEGTPEPTPTPEGDPQDHECGDEFWVCHRPRGNVSNAHEICVGSQSAVNAHLAHCDYYAPCD